MSAHHPPYRWIDPSVERRVTDEPDSAENSAHLFYDHLAGRLGTEISSTLEGAANATTSNLVHRSQVAISEFEIDPAEAALIVVDVDFRCQGVSVDYPAMVDEHLASAFKGTMLTRPFAVVHPGVSGREQRIDDAPIVDHRRIGGGRRNPTDDPRLIPTPNQISPVRFSFTNVAPWDPVLPLSISVGIDNIVDVATNDVSYRLSFTSRWTVERITVSAG